jgi:hypothetical protein
MRLSDKDEMIAELRVANSKYQKALINAAKQIEKLENEVDQLMLRKELVDNDSAVPLEFVRKIDGIIFTKRNIHPVKFVSVLVGSGFDLKKDICFDIQDWFLIVVFLPEPHEALGFPKHIVVYTRGCDGFEFLRPSGP